MQVILNSIFFFLVYFILQIFLYRFFKINPNKLSIILLIIGISVVVGFYSYSTEMLMNLISINLMILCVYIVMSGIDNPGPSLIIIDLIANRKVNRKKELLFYFIKSQEGKAVEKRLSNNILSNFVKVKKDKFFIRKNSKLIINSFNLIKKIYRLKSDA
jgi:amino acid transporter|tara:strand:- start:178 stop:654 length:477 start_codon:yes stop_codon:yes gene_type:complete